MRCQLIFHKNGKADKKLHAYLTVAGTETKWSNVKCAWWKNIAPGQQNMNDTAYIRALRYIGRYISRMSARMSAVFFISFTVWSFGALFSRFSRTTVPFLFLPFSLILFRYVRNLAVANSCTNVNAGRDGFTNCFSLPPPTANPFYSSFLSPLSRTFIPFSFFLFLFTSPPYT